MRASPAEPACPPTCVRSPRSRSSYTLPPARAQAADKPDPPVSRHAPHTTALGQADKRAPSVSRPATASSSSPRSLHHATGGRPAWQVWARGSCKKHDHVSPCATPTLPHVGHRMHRTHHHRPIAIRHWSPWSSAIKANIREP